MNNQKNAQELLEVLMNSKSHNPAWALKDVLDKLRNQLTLPRSVSVCEDEKSMWYDAGRNEFLKEIDDICNELGKL